MFAFGIKYIFAEILKFAFVLDIELSTFAQSILGFPLKSQNSTIILKMFIFFLVPSGQSGELGETSVGHLSNP